MTLPMAQGFPDWQRNIPAANTIYLSVDNQVDTGATYGPFFVGYTPVVGILWESLSGAGRLTVNYWSEAAFNGFMGSHDYSIVGAGQLNCGERALGPWCSIDIIPGGVNIHHNLRIFAQQQTGIDNNNRDTNLLIRKQNIALAAGATATYTATTTWPGMAHITAMQSAGTYTVEVFYADYTGGVGVIDHAELTGPASLRDRICLPGMPVGISIHNTSAASQNHFIYLNGQQVQVQAA